MIKINFILVSTIVLTSFHYPDAEGFNFSIQAAFETIASQLNNIEDRLDKISGSEANGIEKGSNFSVEIAIEKIASQLNVIQGRLDNLEKDDYKANVQKSAQDLGRYITINRSPESDGLVRSKLRISAKSAQPTRIILKVKPTQR